MKLDKLILVNWGALRSDEYPMGNMTLLTGQTGSGKSTMLDALQTVMTAVYQNIFSYNPGQDETTQSARNGKTKRTLWSYIVGAEDNLFARPDGAHGYVAAVFKPDSMEDGEAFTALIAASARVDGSGERQQAVQERLAMLIIDDATLGLADLLSYDIEGSMRVVEVERIEGHLKARYPLVTNFRDAKREYLCQLYGRFRGQRTVSFSEAELAAKAWSQSIAHKPIGSVDELVKIQILEHDPQQLSQRISQISDLMRQVHNLRTEGERLKANVSRLERIGDSVRHATQSYETAIQSELALSKRSLREDERQIGDDDKTVQSLNEKIDAESAKIDGLRRDKQSHTESQIQIAARLSGIPAADQKRRIEERIGNARQTARTAISTLVADLVSADRLQGAGRRIIGIPFPPSHRILEISAGKIAKALTSSGQASFSALKDKLLALESSPELNTSATLELSRELESFQGKFEGLHQSITATEDSFVSAVHSQIEKLTQEISKAEKAEKDLAERKAHLADGGADYPREIVIALRAFKADLPRAHAQVLCDLIEPTNKEWQPAIEGYMAGARFNFVVDSEWEARAIDFVREQNLRAKVIQGSLCQKHAKPELVPTDSIIHELRTEHPIARAFLVEQYGNVVKVASSEKLRHTPRGVMKDGKAAGSRTMFTGDVSALVFGKEAQRLAREKVVSDHKEAETALAELREQQHQLRGVLGLASGLQCPDFKAVSELSRAARDTETALSELGRLDLKKVTALEAEKKTLDELIGGLEQEISNANQRIGNHKQQIETLGKNALRLEQGLEQKRQRVEKDIQNLQSLCSLNDALSFTSLEQYVDDIAEDASQSYQELQDHIQRQRLEASKAYGDVREAIADYNQHAHADEHLDLIHRVDHRSDDFTPTYGSLVQLRTRVREQLDGQRE
ncbi:MAG TPA: ATP-binding protein, partial [Burkholderiales bacterium]|nr:ATP-binding protein [Burkholderiales bacterium]